MIFVDQFVFIEDCDRNLGRTTPQKTSNLVVEPKAYKPHPRISFFQNGTEVSYLAIGSYDYAS